MKFSVAQTVNAGFALILLILFAIDWYAYESTQELRALAERRNHTLVMLLKREALLSRLKDAETGQRGFLLAGDERYLEPYEQALPELRVQLAALRATAVDNSSQQQSLDEIESLLDRKLDELRETIELRRRQGLDGALQRMKSDRGKNIMDEIRALSATMERAEQALLTQQADAMQAQAGKTTWVVILGNALALGFVGLSSILIQREMTERRRAEASTRLYSDIVQSVPIGLTIWRLDDPQASDSLRLVSANPAASTLLGIDVLSMRGQTLTQAFPAVSRADVEHYADVARTGKVTGIREIIYGDERVEANYWSVKAFPLPERCVGLAFDNISERKRTQERIRKFNEELEQRVLERTTELARANQELAHKSQENETFVYSVSHDLRSPLVNLLGFSKELGMVAQDLRGMFADSAVPAAVRQRALDLVDRDMGESIKFIQTAVTRLSMIIDALLRLSRAGRVEYQWQQVDVDAVVHRIVDALHATIAEKAATVTIHALPPTWGDATAVEQIFANLIGNALNYLDPARPGAIEVGAKASAGNSALLSYYVRDNGLGIAEAHIPKVFQALQRLHANVARGEGMGLTLVRRIVERHGGKIWVESSPGVGSTFWVSLPSRATNKTQNVTKENAS